jgi:hypothetical protein
MSHLCCRPCRLRFTPANAIYLTSCPACGLSLARSDDMQSLVGYRLFTDHAAKQTLVEAIAVALREPEPS